MKRSYRVSAKKDTGNNEVELTVLQLMTAAAPLQHLGRQQLSADGTFALRKIGLRAQDDLTAACAARDALLTDENSTPGEGGLRVVREGFEPELLADPLFSKRLTIACPKLTQAMLSRAVLSREQLDQLGPFLAEED